MTSTEIKSLRIVHYPDPRLRAKCVPVTEFGPQLAAIAARMFELMDEQRGVGLAAPQVGLNLRLFVMNPTREPSGRQVVVNPVLSEPEGTGEHEEGCLSIPGVYVEVRRPQRIRLRAQDATGAGIELDATELTARVVQHETDHLDGVLIIDKMGPADKIANRKMLKALEGKEKP